ncbi:hypothetical protein K458DRAFT_296179 [Lentithecium fluviatile CBS 122367]|uniref:Uncharacterized protein n=1 Tax=Lentithecium fluviatile CBS 122367 TaxID=1168545 RepID=A0A6G1JA80_9PLEO|nr:hypothetical protein K458DRAFT_296179 [Lentithecium fluviatile CBS 122367]
MSAAHTCIRSALIRAFRLSNCRAVPSCSVPEFLVPAVARRTRRAFSTTRPHKEGQATAQTTIESPQELIPGRPRLRFAKESTQSRIPSPLPAARGDIQQWLAAIDPFLPPHLRRRPTNDPDVSSAVTPLDLAGVLSDAQEANQDILSYYGLMEQRWETVVWIAKKLVEHGKPSIEASDQLEPSANVLWPETEQRTLDDLTNGPLKTERVRPPRKLKRTLDSLTSMPGSVNPHHRVVKRGIGQLWRSLGNMILVAAEDDHHANEAIMSHVLEIIAYLHHIGFMPDSVYTHKAPLDDQALQQPPTLHLLSTKILTALSDASWRAHEASVKVATERLNASYFLGHEIPGSRYKIQVTEVAPELWLELILWTCLHGGWLLDGSAILQQMSTNDKGRGWGLISWRELLQAKGRDLENLNDWRLFRRPGDRSEKAEDRALTRRTISSEVVSAFVDGLVNTMRLGVGARGTTPEDLVDSIKKLKRFLDLNFLSLGSTTWDTIMSRLLESGGIVPEKRPELLLSILDLASVFGTEVSTVNAASRTVMAESEPPYFFEPTTVPLGLLHRTLRSYIHNGDIAGAMTTMKTLQQYTDSNKQRSLEQFFETLKGVPLRHDEPFTSRLPPIEFPAFENQLPIPLLARLLDLATESKMYELGRWFLFADDLDGPLIPPSMYTDFTMASSIIRFGTLAGENDLVLKIVNKTGLWSNATLTHRMPHAFLTALLCSQVKLHRWQSVQGVQAHVLDSPGYRPEPEVLANFGAELLRFSSAPNDPVSPEKTKACQAFTNFLFTWEGLVLSNVRNQLYCVLAILSGVNGEWKQYCSHFLAFSALQHIKLSTEDFNTVLGGVLDGYGSLEGRKVVDKWCYSPPKTFEPYRAPGGLPTMPTYYVTKGEEYESRPANIEIIQDSGAKLILQGRVYPNRQTVWAILRKVQQEEDERRQRGGEIAVAKRAELRETLKWAARLLYYLGFDYEDIIRDLGSLAGLAGLEAPPASRVIGPDEVEEPGL